MLKFIDHLPAQPRTSHPRIIAAGCPHAPSEVSHRCLKMTWHSKVLKARKSAQSGSATPSDPAEEWSGHRFFPGFFNEHLTGVVSLGPTGENKKGMRSSRIKSREDYNYWLGRTNLEPPAWWSIKEHRLKSHQLVAGVHNSSPWWFSWMINLDVYKCFKCYQWH